jgi:hypothetical protein
VCVSHTFKPLYSFVYSSVTVANSDDEVTTSNNRETNDTHDGYISIGEALSISNNPRYVRRLYVCRFSFENPVFLTLFQSILSLLPSFLPNRIIVLATAPYIIIQANAAYLRYSGSMSSNVLGRPLSNILADQTLLAVLKESNKQLTGASVPGTTLFKISDFYNTNNTHTANAIGGEKDLRAIVSPIGSRKKSVTHFAIELQCHRSNSSSSLDNEDNDTYNRRPYSPSIHSKNNRSRHPMTMMG